MNFIIRSLITFSFLLVFTSGFSQSAWKASHSNKLSSKLAVNSSPQPDTSGFDLHYLRLDINANDTSTNISGFAHYLGTITRQNQNLLIFDLSRFMIIDSLFLDKVKVLYNHNYDLLNIQTSYPYSLNQEFDLKIYYHGSAVYSGFFTGLSTGIDLNYGIPVTWTLSEPFGAKDWFPAKQVLTDKIDSSDMYITCPAYCLAGSNGILKENSITSDGKRIQHWESRYPIDYYLISFTVSNYQDYSFYCHPEGSADSLLVQNYLYNLPAALSAFKPKMDMTGNIIELFATLFGPYPFDREKYGHCLAPINGGMEHQTMTTLSNFEFGLVAHELCHMWFGDHITCASWQDIWLNEGFASYGEYLAHSMIEGISSGRTWMKQAHDQAMITAGGSVYVPLSLISDENRIFNDALSYKKGASVLHMLRYELNDDTLFFNILREYGRRFAYSTATTDDFCKIVEELSSRDFQWFFNQWIYGEGYPVINLSWNQQSRLFTVNTEQIPSSSTPLFKTSMDLQLKFATGDTLVRIWIDDLMNHFEFKLDKPVISVTSDPNNYLLTRFNVIQLFDDVDFKIGPNPASGNPVEVNFFTGSKSREFRIADLNGKIILDFISADKTVQIDSSNLSKGIYLLNIIDGEKSWQVKFVID